MTVRIKHKVNIRIWSETEQKNALFAPDDVLSEITIDNMEHASSGLLTIEDGTDMDLPIPDIQTVMGFMIRSDQDITVTYDGGSHDLKKPSEGTEDAPTYCSHFIECTPGTAINIEKAATIPATDAHVRYVIWGNPES